MAEENNFTRNRFLLQIFNCNNNSVRIRWAASVWFKNNPFVCSRWELQRAPRGAEGGSLLPAAGLGLGAPFPQEPGTLLVPEHRHPCALKSDFYPQGRPAGAARPCTSRCAGSALPGSWFGCPWRPSWGWAQARPWPGAASCLPGSHRGTAGAWGSHTGHLGTGDRRGGSARPRVALAGGGPRGAAWQSRRRCERGARREGTARDEAGPGGAGREDGAGERQSRGLEGCGRGGGPAVAVMQAGCCSCCSWPAPAGLGGWRTAAEVCPP